jgi:hypothetical protein
MESNYEECPCRDCILIPICRRKTLLDLVNKCSIVLYYVYQGISELNKESNDLILSRCEIVKSFIDYEE